MTDYARIGLVGGLGTGKTRSLVLKDLMLHMANVQATGRSFQSMLVEPTFGLVQDILIPAFQEVVRGELGIKVEVMSKGQRPKVIWPKGFKGAQTLLRSAERPKRLAGTNLSHVGFDEPGQMEYEAWKKGGDRARHPRAFIRQRFGVGSPEGLNWYSQLFDFPKPPHVTIRATRWHPDMREYPHELATTYEGDPAGAAAYLDAQFVPMMTGRCYRPFSRERHFSIHAVYNPGLPLIVTCDFNIDAMRWVVLQKHPKAWVFIDEIALGVNGDVQDAAHEFVRRYGYRVRAADVGEGEHSHVGTLIVTGDYAGKGRDATGHTAVDEIKKVFRGKFREIDYIFKPSPLQVDRVRTVNHHLKATGGRQVLIHPARCPELVMDFEQNHWAKGRPAIAKSTAPPENLRTHAGDAAGYAFCNLGPIKKQGAAKVPERPGHGPPAGESILTAEL
ncbi:MAG: hypothetical protein GY716_10250 [bacterium]|nr:hypothetical protein [bacterium]